MYQCLGGGDTSVGSDSRLSIKSGRLMHCVARAGRWARRQLEGTGACGGGETLSRELVSLARPSKCGKPDCGSRSTRHRADLAKSGGPSRAPRGPSRFLNPRARASPSPLPLPQTPVVAILLCDQNSTLTAFATRKRDFEASRPFQYLPHRLCVHSTAGAISPNWWVSFLFRVGAALVLAGLT